MDLPQIYDMPGHLIRRMHQISNSIFAVEISRAGFELTPVQFGAMKVLSEHPGIDQATLAGLIAYDRVTIGGVIDRLRRRGYIHRRRNAQDRRATELELTEQGAELLAAVEPVVLAVQSQMLEGLSNEERDAFMWLLKKLTVTGNERSRVPLRLTEDVFPQNDEIS
jgi:DNA-binding MarR family transcriptional regulator